MGQPVSVIEKPSPVGGRVRFELNRVLTGTGHEVYRVGTVIEGPRPSDELARRLFARGGIEVVHIHGSVVTVTPERGATTEGLREIIHDLYTYYTPGVEPPFFPEPDAPAEPPAG